MCFLSKIILTDSNLFFYLYAFLGNPQLLIITLKILEQAKAKIYIAESLVKKVMENKQPQFRVLNEFTKKA